MTSSHQTDPASPTGVAPSADANDIDSLRSLSEPEARALLEAIPGLSWRPFQRDDLPVIAEFYAACEEFDENSERQSLDSIREFWDSPRSRPEEDTLVAVDGTGAVVATAWSGCNRAITEKRGVYLGGAVRPDRRGEGIGRRVLAWQLAHGRDWDAATREDGFGPLQMRLYAPVDQKDVRDLAERFELQTERYFFEMVRHLDDPVEVPSIDGISIVPWSDDLSARAHQVVNDSFLDHWGFVPTTPQMWKEQVEASSFRPQWSLLAVDDDSGDVVGVAFNCAYEQDWEPQGYTEGYTDELGVLRSHRGRGIASALLLASMEIFRGAGMDAAGLGVDAENPSGALAIYERLGYQRTSSNCVHQGTR